jgi:hypothetical protein
VIHTINGVGFYMRKNYGYSRGEFPETNKTMMARVFPKELSREKFNSIGWEISNDFLLFTAGKTKGRDLIITCHGGYNHFFNSFPIPPGIVLSVLGPHGYPLADPTLMTLATSKWQSYAEVSDQENKPGIINYNQTPDGRTNKTFNHIQNDKTMTGTSQPGHFRNYILSKYEVDAENNYRGVRAFLELNREAVRFNKPRLYLTRTMDVLSVRRRPLMIQPTLKHAIATLIENHIYYDRIILSFCRCTLISFKGRYHMFKSD